jgi:phosphoenolpyruvate carboxykinase (ATP)
VAGTEAGVTEPAATFSTCFGAPFLPLPPKRYAAMLTEKLERHRTPVWLVNTGWTAGGVGVGHRMKLGHTRALLTAALAGDLAAVPFQPDPAFGLNVPTSCPGVPSDVLQPRTTWADTTAYDAAAKRLLGMFAEAYRQYA